jgi:hypothetical protein
MTHMRCDSLVSSARATVWPLAFKTGVYRPHYTDVETGLVSMFFHETQMSPESLPMGNLSWNLSTFQARHLRQLLRLKWGGVHQLTFLLYEPHFCTIFALFYTCRSVPIMSPNQHSFDSRKIANLTQQPQHLFEFFAQSDPVKVSYFRHIRMTFAHTSLTFQ